MPSDTPVFRLVDADAVQALLERVGLVPSSARGARGRRDLRFALLLALATWLPVCLGSLWFEEGKLGPHAVPLSSAWVVHVRSWVALPLFVLCGRAADKAIAHCLTHLHESALVPARELTDMLARFEKLRSLRLPQLVVLVLTVLWTVRPLQGDELRAPMLTPDAWHAGPGSLWYMAVTVPVFAALFLSWLWRIGLFGFALVQLSRLPLATVPTHPDHTFGFGFLAYAPAPFAPFWLAASSTLSAAWAQEVLHHDAPLSEFQVPAAVFAVIALLLSTAPLCAFALPLSRAKLDAMPQYAALVAEHGRKVRLRWILGHEPSNPAVLDAPELGPVADTITLFEAVAHARVVPITRHTLLIVIIPIALPLLGLTLCRIPLREILLELLHTVT